MSSRLIYVRDRLVKAVFVVFVIIVVSFFLIRLPAGDPVDVMASEMGAMDPEYVAGLREQFGLDKPLVEQLWLYLRGVVSLDLGFSYRQQVPVLDLVLQRMPATLLLALTVLVFGLVTGVPLGALAARRFGKWQDSVVSSLAMVSYATPNFWFGLMLVLVFALWVPVLPPYGMESIGVAMDWPQRSLDVAWHFVLPTLALGTHYMAVFARITRASMIEVSNLDFVTAARAKGISEREVFWRHILRNSLLTVVTYAGLQAGNLVGGTVLIETVFALPGMGRLAYDSILGRDYMLLLGIFIVTSVLVILFNLITDVIYTFVDPRIELQ